MITLDAINNSAVYSLGHESEFRFRIMKEKVEGLKEYIKCMENIILKI